MPLAAVIFANDPCPPHSLIPVCLENVLGDPILLWQLRALPEEIDHVCVITGNDHEKIALMLADLKSRGEINGNINCYQGSSAVQSMLGLSEKTGIVPAAQVLLLKATQPLIRAAAIQELASTAGVLAPNEQPDSQRPLIGPMSLRWSELQSAAGQLVQQAAKPGYDDLLAHISKTAQLESVKCDAEDLLHVQTRHDLANAQNVARRRIVDHWLDSGVALTDPASVTIGPRVELAGRGVMIEPQVRLEGRVSVGEGTTIGQGSVVQNSSLGANIEIRPYCVINASIVGDGAKIGPFAHLREGSHLDADVHVGNFVETKVARLRSGAKANHLSYLGDCEIGERSNIGAGCITCNYDGFKKNRTIIGKDAFIGSDCQLVAPVAVGDGAVLGAGTTLTRDAPDDAIVITRPETKMVIGGAARLRAKLKQAKGKSNSQLA